MFIPTAKPYLPKEDITTILKNIEKVLRSGRLYKGHFVSRLESAFARKVDVKHAIALNSGTTALEIALRYFGVDEKEVITPTNTFIATSNAVLLAGGKPILGDMHPETLCLDPQDIAKRITRRTKGVILVHLNGLVTPHIKEIRALCRKKKLFLMEDASHAHGARMYGKSAGAWGDAAAFSCLATKPMTTGGVGGILTTNDKNLDAFARSLRFHGEDKRRGFQNRLGNDWFLSELQAVVGLAQTKRLSEIVRKRMIIAKEYDSAFGSLTDIKIFSLVDKKKRGFKPPFKPPFLLSNSYRHSYYKYPLLFKTRHDKERVAKHLDSLGIQTGSLYWPLCHLQPVYKKMFGYKKGNFPVAEDIISRMLTLPIFAGMTKREIRYVIRCVKEA